MKISNKIIILITYFGRFPWYFSYFLHSCRYNPSIHFLIFSDSETEYALPSNVQIHRTTFEAIKHLISEKIGFEVALDYHYKICDYKPVYGLIFSNHIEGYDFWGISDIDVIFGDIRGFITDEILSSSDVISARHDFLVGYFTLFRNVQKINELFKKSKDYVKVFTNNKHYCFDECNFAFWKMDVDTKFEDVSDQCEIESMTHVAKRLHQLREINVFFDTYALEGVAGKLVWEKGKLIFKRRFEIMLYHLILLKRVYQRNTPRRIPDKFSISPTRIYYYYC